MLNDHAKIMHAVAVSGEIIGRKKLQKMIYIAKKISFPFQEKFQFHFYGPYSEELTLRIEELLNMGFLNEVKEKKGGYVQYRYSLTDSGDEFLKMNKVEMPYLKEVFSDMNTQNARFLELVSTILYFDKLGKAETKEKVFTLKSKQRYTEAEIEEAYQYIDILKQKLNTISGV
ncbi:YwgA family protein [Bacillus aquiflavi]|uniref:YwgA family protein n=1 Tax=Bacillus aquiflavi TaxID=2672567 RepID=A0A6B3VZL0_9BACI|nr:YwgA family protein [Bacillus aquiflavi]MBA4537442.1 YwgA family protein [Bacillus aquiflavi]NEY81697.1 YwgA family protein [Bacillus aquiflavi]